MTYRSGKGRFVPAGNPCAVAAVVNGRNTQQRATERASVRAQVMAARRADAARNGYLGPLTRAELSATAALSAEAAA
jgi:hypothetical protein